MAKPRRYGFYYAIVVPETGECIEVRDTTDFILDPIYIPIEEYSRGYLLKYYHPIPSSVSSFDDFTGQWYVDSDYATIYDPNE